MAIFQGEEIVPVTTVDGRTLQLPRSLAGMIPASMLPAPSSNTLGGVPGEPAPIDVPAMSAPPMPAPTPTPAPDGVVEAVEPDIVPVDMAPEVVTANPKRVQKMRAQKAAYDATPEGKQAAAQKTQAAAQQAQADAVNAQINVDVATNDLLHGAMVERNAALANAEQARNEEMLTRAQEQETKMNEVVGYRKKIENTKIDRNLDHPIMTAIGAALVGIGQGMKNEKITTLEIIHNAIDRKVAAQEADLDRMAKVYGMAKDDLEMLKEKSKNRLEFHNAMIAAETNKAIRVVEEMTARSASDKTRANGQAMIAELQARAADKTMEATRWGLEYGQRDQAERNQNSRFYSDLKFRKKQHTDDMQIKREQIAADMAKALANTKATGDAERYKLQLEAAKEARQFGVRGMDGEFYLSPEGRAQMAQAKALEDEAAKLESNPDVMARSIASDKIKAMRDKAAVMRGEAQTFGTIKAHNETEAIAVSNMISSGQSVVQLIDEIKQISDKARRGLISRDEAQVALRAKFELLKPGLKEAWQLGAWDKGASGLTDKVIGLDPSSDWNAGTLAVIVHRKMFEDPKAFQQGLDSVATDLENKARNKLVGLGTKFGAGESVLQRTSTPEASASAASLTQARSGMEATVDAESTSTFSKTMRAGWYPLSPSHAQEAENSQSTKYVGLSKAQEAPFEERLRAYKSGDKRAGEELVAIAAEAAQNRPDLAVPLLHNLREHARKLYDVARGAVPKGGEVDKQMAYEESIQTGPAITPTDMLARTVLGSLKADGTIGDTTGYADLATRAGEGDAVAKKAILKIAEQSGINKTLPRGSVFRGGN